MQDDDVLKDDEETVEDLDEEGLPLDDELVEVEKAPEEEEVESTDKLREEEEEELDKDELFDDVDPDSGY